MISFREKGGNCGRGESVGNEEITIFVVGVELLSRKLCRSGRKFCRWRGARRSHVGGESWRAEADRQRLDIAYRLGLTGVQGARNVNAPGLSPAW